MAKRLGVAARSEKGKGPAGRLRARGTVPGIIYGRHKENSPVQADARELETAVSRGERMVMVEFEGEEKLAIFREVQHHPVTQKLLHFDLYEVASDQSVRVALHLELVGRARGAEEGGAVEQNVHDVEIECPAGRLPPHLELDVSGLGIGGHLCASEVRLPEGARLVEDAGLVVATCHAPRVEEEEVVVEEAAPALESAEPEVITRRKEEPEAEVSPPRGSS